MSAVINLMSVLTGARPEGQAASEKVSAGFAALFGKDGAGAGADPAQGGEGHPTEAKALKGLYNFLAGLGKKVAQLDPEGDDPAATIEAVAGLATDMATALAGFESETGSGLVLDLQEKALGDGALKLGETGDADATVTLADPVAAVQALKSVIATVTSAVRDMAAAQSGSRTEPRAGDASLAFVRGVMAAPVGPGGAGASDAESFTESPAQVALAAPLSPAEGDPVTMAPDSGDAVAPSSAAIEAPAAVAPSSAAIRTSAAVAPSSEAIRTSAAVAQSSAAIRTSAAVAQSSEATKASAAVALASDVKPRGPVQATAATVAMSGGSPVDADMPPLPFVFSSGPSASVGDGGAQALLARIAAVAADLSGTGSAPDMALGAVAGLEATGAARRLGPVEPLIAPEDVARALAQGGQPGRDQAAGAASSRGAETAAEPSRFAGAVASQISSAEIGEGRTRIELSPRGLGTIEVDVTTGSDGALKVVVRAENPAVLNALREERDLLAQVLGGLDTGSLDLQSFSDSNGQERQGERSTGPSFLSAEDITATGAESAPAHKSEIGGGRLDIVT